MQTHDARTAGRKLAASPRPLFATSLAVNLWLAGVGFRWMLYTWSLRQAAPSRRTGRRRHG